MKYLRASAIILNAAGKMESIRTWDEISRANKSYSVNELLYSIANKEIQLSNMKLTPDRKVLITVENFDKIQILTNEFNYNSLEIQFDVINIIYETRYVTQLFDDEELMESKVVLAVDIKCNNQLQLDYLHAVGGKDIGDNKVRVKAVQLRHMMHNSISLERRLRDFGIVVLALNNTLVYLSDKWGKTRTEEDNTNKTRLEHWIKKSSIMGISKDYSINIMQSKLMEYSGKETVPVIPPVRIIGDYAFDRNNNIEILNIPNSVEVINCRLGYIGHIGYTLKEVNIGDNVHSITNDRDSLNCLLNIKEIDFKNIMEIPNLTSIGLLSKIKVNIGAKLHGLPIVNSTTLELRE